MRLTRRVSWSTDAGMSLVGVLVGMGLFGMLMVVGTRLATQEGARSRHLEDRGRVDHVHDYLQNSLSCVQTLKDQVNDCAVNRFITARDHTGKVLINKFPRRTILDKDVELRARCEAQDGYFEIEPDFRLIQPDGRLRQDRMTGKEANWQPLMDGAPFACPCLTLPPSNRPRPPVAVAGGMVRSTLFFGNVAVDPGASRVDACTKFGLTPFPLSAPSTLAVTTFVLPTNLLTDLIANHEISSLELTAFAHQFLMGLDRVGIDFAAIDASASLDSIPNIYSAYGYVHLTDLKMRDGVPRGKVAINVFEHFTGATALGIGSLQDATNLVKPMSPLVPPKRVFNDVDLRNVKISVRIYANSYDSVQYRAVRLNAWAKKPIAQVAACR